MGFDDEKAFTALKLITTGAAGMFAGAAAYINTCEHPARMALADTKMCHKQWKESFDRAKVYQGRLALVTVASGLGAYYLKSSSTGTPWLIAAGTMATIFPYTLFILKPNSIDPIYDDEITAKKSENFIRGTVNAWNSYHAFRTVVGFSTFLWCLGHLTSDKLW